MCRTEVFDSLGSDVVMYKLIVLVYSNLSVLISNTFYYLSMFSFL